MRYRSHFGVEAIVPRIYSKSALVNDSVVDDFAEAISLRISQDELEKPSRLNERTTAFGLEVLRRINQKIPLLGDDDRPNPLRQNIASYTQSFLKSGPAYSLPDELYNQYQEEFRESNEWVRREYFPDRSTLFDDAQNHEAEVNSCEATELDQIADMISAIWLEKARISNRMTFRLARRFRSFFGYVND